MIPLRIIAIPALAVVATTAALGDARTEGDLRTLRAHEALLVLPLHARGELKSLEFLDPARKSTFVIEDIPDRLSLVLVKIPPGDYHLSKIVLPKDFFVKFEANDKWIPRFTVTGGAINLVGDVRITNTLGKVITSFGANTLDALPLLLRREGDLVPDLFTRFPLVLGAPLDGTALVGRAPDRAWTLADWMTAMPHLRPEVQTELVDRALTRLGVKTIAIGTGFADAVAALEKIDKRRGHIDPLPGDQRILVVLDGLWGERGQVMALELMFAERRLVQSLVRGRDDSEIWGIPAADARLDLEEFAAGR